MITRWEAIHAYHVMINKVRIRFGFQCFTDGKCAVPCDYRLIGVLGQGRPSREVGPSLPRVRLAWVASILRKHPKCLVRPRRLVQQPVDLAGIPLSRRLGVPETPVPGSETHRPDQEKELPTSELGLEHNLILTTQAYRDTACRWMEGLLVGPGCSGNTAVIGEMGLTRSITTR